MCFLLQFTSVCALCRPILGIDRGVSSEPSTADICLIVKKRMFAVCWFFAVFQPSWSKKIAVCCLLFFRCFPTFRIEKIALFAVCCFSLFPTFRIKKLFYFCQFLTAEKERLSRVPEGTKSTMMRPCKKKHDAQMGMRVPPANSTRKNRGKSDGLCGGGPGRDASAGPETVRSTRSYPRHGQNYGPKIGVM